MKIVVKVEITSLITPEKKFDKKKFERLTMVLTNLRNSGIEILVVSSGAIFLGATKLGLENLPVERITKQAVAAVGQVELMKYYRCYFDMFSQVAAQILLTNDVINNPIRNRNTKNTLINLLSKKIIPIINENDSVSTDDIDLDDNYYMVLNVASIVDAELIIVKSKENGKFLLIHRGNKFENIKVNENKLIEIIINIQKKISYRKYLFEPFPPDINKLSFHN